MNLSRIYLAIVLLGLLSFFQCSQEETNSLDQSIALQNLKEYPNDVFSFQRSYPYQRLDIEAYEAGLKAAHLAKSQRNTSPGFDASWTNQGPGNAGSRVNTIEVHPTDEDIIYLGYASGGVFKTIDGGTNWNPIFDDQPFLAIGDIAMDPSDSETIYVGTGDPNITGYPAIGDGIYRSTDGGANWTHLGLTDQRIISKIIVDPNDPETIYAACMGLPFERNNDRGLYKTTDGGQTWSQILFVSDQAGIIDMVINPDDPSIIYASSWDRLRNNQESFVKGPNAKIFKTTDGGVNWTQLTNGLPSGELGRIGLAMAGSDPDILVTVIVAENQSLGGIYRTEDAGASWSEIPTASANGLGSGVLGGFGWYFGKIRIHPVNDDWYYLLGVSHWFTSNNGMTWSQAHNGSTLTPHVDHHDLVFNHQNDILLGNDGGAYKRESGSLNYSDIENIPATQVYRVAYDPHRPDNYYGGTQDNGTQQGNEPTMNNWSQLLGGDGFQMRFDPTDENIVYAETQNGNIFRSSNGLSGFISSTIGINPNDRRNWDMQYFLSPHEPSRIYTGTYRVYKSETSGTPAWSAISSDLTDGNVFGSPFHTISTLTESALVEDLLYVGTTDANVWRSEDGGTSWDSLHMTLPNRYITSIKTSPDIADNVFVSISGYRNNEFVPRLYKSTDRGDNWTSISGNLPDLAVNDIIVLPGHADQILFVATDGGIYATTNGGGNWELLGVGMPIVTVYDMEWNESKNELVAGTFGRSIYSYPIDSILNNLNASFAVNGQILNEAGVGVDSSIVTFTGDVNQSNQTDPDGSYSVENLTGTTSCLIEPKKDINIRNGLTTFDILQMQKHILFIDTLDSPYKIIAGDVNNSKTLSISDVVVMRKVLLFDQNTFNDVDSWRFVPADYVFSNPIKPFLDDFPETITCEDIQNGSSADFIGFKVGDVSGNADPTKLLEEAKDRNDALLEFFTEDRQLIAGASYAIPIRAKSFNNITGFQFGLKASSQAILKSIDSGGALDFNEQNYFLDRNTNEVSLSWSNPQSIKINQEEAVIYLNIRVLKDVKLSEFIEMKATRIRAEAYNEQDEILEPVLTFYTNDHSISKDLIIAPNPFTTETELQFELAKSEMISLMVYDQSGKLVHTQGEVLVKGSHSIVLTSAHLNATGIYFYQLITASKTYNGKLIKS